MADDTRFDIDIADALATATRDEEAELKKQVTLAAGLIVGKVQKLANAGELVKLQGINSLIDQVIAGRVPRRDQGQDQDRTPRRDGRGRDNRDRDERPRGGGSKRRGFRLGSDRARDEHRAP